MYLLFKNIPIGTKDYELADFITYHFNPIDKEKLSISAAGIEILERQDNYSHPVEQFGLLRVVPDNMAKTIISELNNCFFNDIQITVREYFDRSISNDPRINSNVLMKSVIEQRKKERRNHTLIYSRHI